MKRIKNILSYISLVIRLIGMFFLLLVTMIFRRNELNNFLEGQ